MANLGYVRVSTILQNDKRQFKTLEKYDLDKVFKEKVSAKDRDRPQLKALLDYAREGDTIYISSFDRLARSTKDLLEIVEQLTKKGIELISNKEQLDTSTPTGRLMLTMIGAINEFERENLLERQREGIQIAVEQGKYKGRKPIEVDNNFIENYNKYLKRVITTKRELAEILDISRPTLDKLINEYEQEQAKEA